MFYIIRKFNAHGAIAEYQRRGNYNTLEEAKAVAKEMGADRIDLVLAWRKWGPITSPVWRKSSDK